MKKFKEIKARIKENKEAVIMTVLGIGVATAGVLGWKNACNYALTNHLAYCDNDILNDKQATALLTALSTVGMRALEDKKYNDCEIDEILKDVDGLDDLMEAIS